MTIHITSMGTRSLCGAPGRRLSLKDLVRFYPLTYVVMKLSGCRYCGAELRDALRMARRIV